MRLLNYENLEEGGYIPTKALVNFGKLFLYLRPSADAGWYLAISWMGTVPVVLVDYCRDRIYVDYPKRLIFFAIDYCPPTIPRPHPRVRFNWRLPR
jgi:hypothetical protein